MAYSITANELKTKGISALGDQASEDDEIIVTVRGRNKYVILPIEQYNHLRECELEAALRESKKDIKAGKFLKESVERHIKRISRA